MATQHLQPELIPASDSNWQPEKQDALAPITPMGLIREAIANKYDMTQLKDLFEMAKEWQRDQARMKFESAMTKFKAETFTIPKDKENKQYNSWYTSLEMMVHVVTPFLARHELFHTWSVDQSNGIKITCQLEGFGHSKTCSVTFPPDVSGKKNSLQEIKSAITYGKISTFEAVCGLASEAGNLSDDGNAAGKRGMTGDEAERLQEWIDSINSSSSFEELDVRFREAWQANPNNQTAKDAIAAAKNEMRGRLRKAGAR